MSEVPLYKQVSGLVFVSIGALVLLQVHRPNNLCTKVASQFDLQYTPENALQYAPEITLQHALESRSGFTITPPERLY